MKVGEKAKGFWFESNITEHPLKQFGKIGFIKDMHGYVGKEGTITEIHHLKWGSCFDISFDDGKKWSYPMVEYLRINREERLNELGID
jgi:hypothetical protein